MSKWERWIKREFEVEMLACVHAFVMIFAYLLGKFVTGNDGITFWQAVQMGLLAYISAWIQELAFGRAKVYSRREHRVRALLWSGIPIILTLASGMFCGWFKDLRLGLAVYFYCLLSAYYILLFFFVQHFLREDSRKLNRLLEDYKKGSL